MEKHRSSAIHLSSRTSDETKRIIDEGLWSSLVKQIVANQPPEVLDRLATIILRRDQPAPKRKTLFERDPGLPTPVQRDSIELNPTKGTSTSGTLTDPSSR